MSLWARGSGKERARFSMSLLSLSAPRHARATEQGAPAYPEAAFAVAVIAVTVTEVQVGPMQSPAASP